MIVVEATAGVDAGGTTANLRLATEIFVTSPADSPPNAAFHPSLRDPGKIGRSAFGDGRTGGGARLETGEVVALNNDGTLDPWLDASFDGREVVIRAGDKGAAYPGGFTVLFRGTAEAASGDAEKLVLQLRDKLIAYDKPHLTMKYDGSNVLPAGLEGTDQDIKGLVKPKVYGRVRNMTPRLVNTAKLTFQVSTGAAAIDAVYDQGVARVFGQDYASAALLQAAVLAGGEAKYSTCKAAGLFRLHDGILGTITADVTEGATSADRTLAQVFQRIALAAGLPAAEISAEDIAALDAVFPAEMGVLVEDEQPTRALLDLVARSGGASYDFDSDGVLRIVQLTAPAGPPAAMLTDDHAITVARRSANDNMRPLWSVKVRYRRNWTVQGSNDVVASIPADRRAMLAEEYLSTSPAEAAAVKAQWLLADELTVDTLLDKAEDAVIERDRQLAMHQVRRNFYDVTLKETVFRRLNLGLMSVLELRHRRFGLAEGKLFRVLGVRLELRTGRVILTVWG